MNQVRGVGRVLLFRPSPIQGSGIIGAVSGGWKPPAATPARGSPTQYIALGSPTPATRPSPLRGVWQSTRGRIAATGSVHAKSSTASPPGSEREGSPEIFFKKKNLTLLIGAYTFCKTSKAM